MVDGLPTKYNNKNIKLFKNQLAFHITGFLKLIYQLLLFIHFQESLLAQGILLYQQNFL